MTEERVTERTDGVTSSAAAMASLTDLLITLGLLTLVIIFFAIGGN